MPDEPTPVTTGGRWLIAERRDVRTTSLRESAVGGPNAAAALTQYVWSTGSRCELSASLVRLKMNPSPISNASSRLIDA